MPDENSRPDDNFLRDSVCRLVNMVRASNTKIIEGLRKVLYLIKVKSILSLCLIDWAACHENLSGGGEGWRCKFHNLNFVSRWRWLLSFMLLLLYPRWISLRYPIVWAPRPVQTLQWRDKACLCWYLNSNHSALDHHCIHWANPALI
jgi:hypothetical protein